MEDDKERGRSRRRRQDVRIDTVPSIVTVDNDAARAPSSTTSGSSGTTTSWLSKVALQGRSHFDWVSSHWNWYSLKPVLRCWLAGWIAAVLFAIPAVDRWMGNASFLILIASFLSPPNDPFVAVLERELLILLFVCLSWAWSTLGLKLASLARREFHYGARMIDVIDGRYVEAGPSVIAGVFIAIGSSFFLFVKARQGPGPYLFACIFACICLDISLTTAVLFPYPYYRVGLSIFVPLAVHSAIALFVSLTFLPVTISSGFTERLQAFYSPLSGVLKQHAVLLNSPTGTEEFEALVQSLADAVKKQEGVLISIAAAGRLLSSDLLVCRFAPHDFKAFLGFARRLAGRLQGMNLYFRLIDPEKDKFYSGSVTPWTSGHNTPTVPGTPSVQSRAHTPERTPPTEKPEHQYKNGSPPLSPSTSRGQLSALASKPWSPSHSRTPSGQHKHHHHHHHLHLHTLHDSLLNLSLKSRHRRAEKVVGVFESQKYLNLEAKHMNDPRHDEWVQTETELLGKGCAPLLKQCSESIDVVTEWFASVRTVKWNIFRRTKHQQERVKLHDKILAVRGALATVLKDFRTKERLRVIEPYHPVVEVTDDESVHKEIPPHRHLFHCYVYQYNLIQVAGILVELLDEIVRLEGERKQLRLWTPVSHLFRWNENQMPETREHIDDDDPDVIQGAHDKDLDDLGLPKRRDPDALPPRNVFEVLMNAAYRAGESMTHGNSLFAIKAGLVAAALCLPFLIKGSAGFAYTTENRYVWAIIMGQLTMARFRGDTTFGLAARIFATLFGGVIGMVMWYISAGSGTASPYAFAAVCGVSFPFFYMVWLYAPIPPMPRLIIFVTAMLVLGYSYQDTHMVIAGAPGHGWEVAWKRFVLVTIGVVAAFIASLLPPTMTLRRYQRSTLSTTCSELGTIYCATVSFATERRPTSVQEIISTLLATRSKLNRSATLSTNIVYEFSLRGRWPKKRYRQILDLQIAVSYSISHLLSVIEHLEPRWTQAFLKRSRFLDPDFQGDVLAVFSMISNSLRTGNPLPQVTPCPLVDRFMMRYHGLDVIHRDSEEDYGLPRLLTLETLQNEQYMMFCVGVSTAYSLINRLDRLMLATKEIVGEQYHIHGVNAKGGVRGQVYQGMMPLSPSVSYATAGMQAGAKEKKEV
ncbi:hypothetical protein D9611_012858 [Ephemerocybe angulata]|uniref:DUF2421 domain-containing protein n=1 Tax=Ephemerocybe angulata TaxID=980116 RepID=A0A8H5F176_9AGAR|nr:hypothetical protein D9611_012858 [Tulosesus angulatus]